MKSKKIFITASMTIMLIIVGIRISYAWFKAADRGSSDSAMGTVDVTISDNTEVSNGALSFTIKNDSNIDTYMRLGWTPVYKNGNTELTKDVKSIEVANVKSAGTDNPEGLILNPGRLTSLNAYEKNAIILEDENGSYFIVPAKADISGTITVTGYHLEEKETLHLVLVPEAIQATSKAVEAAGDYGWLIKEVVTND